MLRVLLVLLLVLQTKGGVEIKDAWLRVGAKGMNTALYFEMTNRTANSDTLYRAESTLAEKVEVHETYMQGNEMGMRETKFVEIKSNSKFSFKPRGHHIMLIGLKERLTQGMTGEVTLYFKHAGKVKVKAEVRR